MQSLNRSAVTPAASANHPCMKNRKDRVRTGPLARRQAIAQEDVRARKASIGLPPLLRVKRAPGEVNPKGVKRGGINRQGRMIERGNKKGR